MIPAFLPDSQLEHLEKIQNALLRDLANEVSRLDKKLSSQVRATIVKLRKTGYKPNRIRAEIEGLLEWVGSQNQRQLLRLVQDAKDYADRYQRRLLRYSVAQTHPLTPSEIKWASEGMGGAPARAAISYARGRTAGDKGALFSKKGQVALSRQLHLLTSQEIDEVTGAVLRSISEAQELGFASRELVEASRYGLGKGQSLPKLVREVQGKAATLAHVTGGNLAPEIEQNRKYAKRLKGGIQNAMEAKKIGVPLKKGVPFVRAGRMQAAYMELIDDLEKGTAAEAAIKKWAYQKQRYNAETILYSETTAAFRQRQVQFAEGKPWIIGYQVKLNRGRHARWKASKPGKLKKLGGRSCVCEVYDGTIITVEEYRDQWYRGFHPRCSCRFREVVDREAMWRL